MSQSALHGARHALRVVRSDRLCDERIERHQRARMPKIDTLKKYRLPERDRGQHRRRQSPDHERVHDAHGHEAQLHEHDGNRERHRRAQLRLPRTTATFEAMRIWHLVTVAGLGLARDSAAQAISVAGPGDSRRDACRSHRDAFPRSPKATCRSRS